MQVLIDIDFLCTEKGSHTRTTNSRIKDVGDYGIEVQNETNFPSSLLHSRFYNKIPGRTGNRQGMKALLRGETPLCE
jgi:hypothetical protein